MGMQGLLTGCSDYKDESGNPKAEFNFSAFIIHLFQNCSSSAMAIDEYAKDDRVAFNASLQRRIF
jgi:hypothetical protein